MNVDISAEMLSPLARKMGFSLVEVDTDFVELRLDGKRIDVFSAVGVTPEGVNDAVVGVLTGARAKR